MAYNVIFARTAQRQFAKLPRQTQERLGAAIDRLAGDPRPPGVVKLSAEEGLYRIRDGDYRAIYRIEDDRLVVLVVKVGHRRHVYR